MDNDWVEKLSKKIEVEQNIVEVSILILIVGFCLLVFLKVKNRQKYLGLLMLAVYLFLSLCSTILFRPQSDIAKYNFTPFWSYGEIKKGLTYLLYDNIYNVLFFIPVGFFLRFLSRKINVWHALLYGLLFSIMIETIQLFSRRGFAETDDVIHNTLGTGIGYIITQSVAWIWNKLVPKKTIQ